MSTYNRLSDKNISDPVLRGHFYALVLDYVRDVDNEVEEYVIKVDEEYRRDLASQRAYGTPEAGWVIGLMSDVDDDSEPVEAGTLLYLPPAAWLRRALRDFIAEYGSE